MMSNVHIISPHPSRWQEVKALRLEALQQDPTAFGSSYEEELAFEDDIWQKRILNAYKRDGVITLYAEHDSKLIGMMGAGWSQRIKTGHIADVFSVYVTPSRRGNGIASMLMQALLDDLATLPQIKKVTLSVVTVELPAIALYKKFGFQQIGISQRALFVDGQYYDFHLMERLL